MESYCLSDKSTKTDVLLVFDCNSIWISTVEDPISPSTEGRFFSYSLSCSLGTDGNCMRTGSALKYKKVADRIRPVPTTLPEDFRIVRKRHPMPLDGLPTLPKVPPCVSGGSRFTQERMDEFEFDVSVLPEERKLVLWMMKEQEDVFAWEESERGTLKSEFYPPVLIPTIEHIPWKEKNIPIPPALFE